MFCSKSVPVWYFVSNIWNWKCKLLDFNKDKESQVLRMDESVKNAVPLGNVFDSK